jgi:hypothetical protein
MNATPIRPGSNEREELVQLLPQPTDRDLPSDRHRQLQEFFMNHIQQDLRSTAERTRRSPRRHLAYVTSGLAAAAAVAVAAVAIGGGAPALSGDGDSTDPARRPLSGQKLLLVAAQNAAKAPEGTGAYWYVKVVMSGTNNGESFVSETWTARGGRTWTRGEYRNPAATASPGTIPEKRKGEIIELSSPNPFQLGGAEVTLEQLRALPAEPAALRTRIDNLIKNSEVRTSAGGLTAAQRERAVFEGLVSLVTQLPAPPRVRAAAFRAFASYPNVHSIGAVDGGQGLLISFLPGEPPARLVIDPATAQVRRTNVVVLADGGIMTAAEGVTLTLTAGWTNTLPR